MRRARAAIIFAAFLAAGNASDEPLSIKLGLESLPIIGYNLAAVDDSLYRSAMPDKYELSSLKERGLEVVISVRGHNPGRAFHDGEKELCDKLGLKFETVQFSAAEPSDPEQYIRFIELLNQYKADKKLVHCNSGCDRSSLAAALYVLYQGGNLEDANKQFSARRGFFKGDNYMMELVKAVAEYIKDKENKPEAIIDFFSAEYLKFYREHHPMPRVHDTGRWG